MANDNYIKLIKEVGTAMGGMHQAHEYICVYITNVVTHTHTYIHTYSHTQICLYVHNIYICYICDIMFVCVCLSVSLYPIKHILWTHIFPPVI